MKIILASASPRRKELMAKLNIPFDVLAYNHEELLDDSKTIYDQCMDIAYQKGKIVFANTVSDVIVISSDTIVALDNIVYGKPKDNDDAYKMIKELQGRTHEVVTALTIFVRKNNEETVQRTYEKAQVTIDKMCDEEIREWVNSGLAMGKAGSYGIQDSFGRYIKSISGDYYSIVGLPLNKLYNMLKELEVYDELR